MPMSSDNNLRVVREISLVTPGKRTEKKSPQQETKTIKRNLKQDFSPNQGKKEERPHWNQRENSVQKRCVTSPGDVDGKKRKASPLVKAYCINHPTRNAVYRGKGGFNCCQDCLDLLNQQNNIEHQGRTPQKVVEKENRQESQAEMAKREEINFYVKDIEENLVEIPKIREELSTEYRQREDMIENMKEEIRNFTEKVVEVVREQAESSIASLEKEFAGGMNSIRQANGALENCKDMLLQMKKYMEKNTASIIQNTRTENMKLKEQYVETCNNFQDVVKEIHKILNEPVKVIPLEKIAGFKSTLKATVSEIFNGCAVNQTVASQPLPEMKNLGDLEKFLKSEESEDALKIKMVKEKPNTNMIISFDNKDMFLSALTGSTKGMNLASIQEAKTGTLSSQLFRMDSDDFSTMVFSGAHGTPRLHCESELGDYDEYLVGDDDLLGSNDCEDPQPEEEEQEEDSKLGKFVDLLNKVNQKQNSRTDYLSKQQQGRKNSQVDGYGEFINYLENKLKDEGIRETSFQKSLFHSPQFKEI